MLSLFPWPIYSEWGKGREEWKHCLALFVRQVTKWTPALSSTVWSTYFLPLVVSLETVLTSKMWWVVFLCGNFISVLVLLNIMKEYGSWNCILFCCSYIPEVVDTATVFCLIPIHLGWGDGSVGCKVCKYEGLKPDSQYSYKRLA